MKKLGKISEIIGRVLFSLSVTIMCLLLILQKIQTHKQTDIGSLVGGILGTTLVIILCYFIIRTLFRPIYRLNENVELILEEKITTKDFKKRWIISLICSLILGIIPIVGTFGISLLLMIPQYLLLIKTKDLKSNKIVKVNEIHNYRNNIDKTKFNILEKSNKTLNTIKSKIGVLSNNELIIFSIVCGVLIGLILGYIFGGTAHYSKNGARISFKSGAYYTTYEFNYLVGISSFIISGGVIYLLTNKKDK